MDDKRYDWQIYASFVPGFGLLAVFMATGLCMKRCKMKLLATFPLLGIMFLVMCVMLLTNAFVLASWDFRPLVTWAFTVLACLLLVEFQKILDGMPGSRQRLWKGIGILLSALTVYSGVMFVAVSCQMVPDTNGPENHALSTYTQADVLESNRYCAAFHIIEGSSDEPTDVPGSNSQFDAERRRVICPLISGVSTVTATQGGEAPVTLNIYPKVTKGNLEVFVIVDGIIHTAVPVNEETTLRLEDVDGKLILVKYAAEDANINIHVERTIG